MGQQDTAQLTFEKVTATERSPGAIVGSCGPLRRSFPGCEGLDRVYDHRTVERLRQLMALMPLVEGVKGLLAA